MAKIEIKCIHCGSIKIVKFGKQANGTPRYKCNKCSKIFQVEYLNNGSKPETKDLIIKMTLTWKWYPRHRSSSFCKQKYCKLCFKKTKHLITNINPNYQNIKKPLKIRLEMDEMWGRVYCKKTPCWLWHAINHDNGDIIAYVFGTRKHDMLKKLLKLLYSLNIEIEEIYTDNNFAYCDAIPINILKTGKKNTQKIERKHLTFRTRLKRLARKTICYSKSLEMHMICFGLLINVLEFGLQLF